MVMMMMRRRMSPLTHGYLITGNTIIASSSIITHNYTGL